MLCSCCGCWCCYYGGGGIIIIIILVITEWMGVSEMDGRAGGERHINSTAWMTRRCATLVWWWRRCINNIHSDRYNWVLFLFILFKIQRQWKHIIFFKHYKNIAGRSHAENGRIHNSSLIRRANNRTLPLDYTIRNIESANNKKLWQITVNHLFFFSLPSEWVIWCSGGSVFKRSIDRLEMVIKWWVQNYWGLDDK